MATAARRRPRSAHRRWRGRPDMHLPIVLGELHRGETLLASAYAHNATTHADEADVHHQCTTFSNQAQEHAEKLRSAVAKYGEVMPDQPDRLYAELFTG